MTKKRRYERKHARKRARERFGEVLHQDLETRIVRDIQTARAQFIERQSNTRTVFLASTSGVAMPVVYDKLRKSIVTVLPAAYAVRKGVHSSYVEEDET